MSRSRRNVRLAGFCRRDSNLMNYSFPKSHRLTKGSEFDAVFDRKQSRADRHLVVYAAANELGHPRLGLVVSRKVSKRAVVRNRWKRLLREAFRLVQHDLPPLDLVCLPRAGTEPELHCLMHSLRGLARRLAALPPRVVPAGNSPDTDPAKPEGRP
jgi:ribonuclease P protein component